MLFDKRTAKNASTNNANRPFPLQIGTYCCPKPYTRKPWGELRVKRKARFDEQICINHCIKISLLFFRLHSCRLFPAHKKHEIDAFAYTYPTLHFIHIRHFRRHNITLLQRQLYTFAETRHCLPHTGAALIYLMYARTILIWGLYNNIEPLRKRQHSCPETKTSQS